MADQPPPEPPPSPYPYPSRPPTEAGPLITDSEPSKWPTVIGVIVIVLAAFGLIGGFCCVLTPNSWSTVPADANPGAEYVREWSGWIVFSSLVGLAFSGVLLAIGIGLIKRRFWSRAWAIRWSVVYMAYALASLIFNLFIQQGPIRADDAARQHAGWSGTRHAVRLRFRRLFRARVGVGVADLSFDLDVAREDQG